MRNSRCYLIWNALCLLLSTFHLTALESFQQSAPVIRITSSGSHERYENLALALEDLADNETILLAGRHTIMPRVTRGLSPAPLHIQGKTNISIKGMAGAEIYGEGPGDFLSIENCQHVVLENVNFIGNKPTVTDWKDLYAMLLLTGTNSHVRFDGCRFQNFGSHGVSHLFGYKTSTEITVQNCFFKNGGATNVPSLSDDGAAISGIGSHWTVANNHFEECLRGIEIEGAAPTDSRHVIVRDNVLKNTGNIAIMIFPYPGGSGGQMHDIIISGNQIHGVSGTGTGGNGILVLGGERISIQGNTIRDVAQVGISANNDFQDLKDSLIAGNMVSECGWRGIQVWEYPRQNSITDGVAIRGNTVIRAGEAGIKISGSHLDIIDNVCKNGEWWAEAAGIQVANSPRGSSGIILDGNRCTDSREAKLQNYGIWIGNGVPNAVVRNNWCLGNENSGIRDDGVNTHFSGNFPSGLLNIVQQPTAQTVVSGTKATFTVAVTGQPPFRYQWYKNNLPISGATARSYSIPITETTDNGSYSVAVSNAFETITSLAADLNVCIPQAETFPSGGGTSNVVLPIPPFEIAITNDWFTVVPTDNADGTSTFSISTTPNEGATRISVLDIADQLLVITQAGATQATRTDFTGDGIDDLLLQRDDGLLTVWQLEGTNFMRSLPLRDGVPVPNWRAFGVGDFNSDGKPDIAFQNRHDGKLAVWLMDGTNLLSNILLANGNGPSPIWHAVSIADFNWDAKRMCYCEVMTVEPLFG